MNDTPLTRDEQYLIREQASRCCTTSYRDRILQSFLLRAAQNEVQRKQIQGFILDARAQWRISVTMTQRKWMRMVSRRVNRGNHHDSWATRESYTRCHGSYTDYLPYAHTIWTGYRPGQPITN